RVKRPLDLVPVFDFGFEKGDPEGSAEGDIGDRIPLVINQWTAERLQATLGTPLRVAFFEPEVKDGDEIERTFDAIVTDIVPLTEPIRRYYRSRDAVFDKPPTVYNCPELTPTVPGVTDKDSIDDWDVPFEMTRDVSSDDDRYVHNHRLTPKAFLPLETGQRLFGSRFGSVTGFRIDPSAVGSIEELKAKLTDAAQPVLPELGWHIRSIRESQLAASAGTTPFDGLFLSLSFFVIFAAVMLIAMLFRLGLASRSRELGTLMAIGWERGQVSKLFLSEGALIAVVGALLGIAGGIGYAVFVLAALRTFWVGAVTVPFLTFHASPISVLGGALAGLLMGMLAVWWTLRSLLKNQAISLLRGSDDSDQIAADNGPRSNRLRYVAMAVFVAALGAAIAGSMSGGQTAAGGFVGGGMLLLVAILIFVYDVLRRSVHHKQDSELSVGSLLELARSNASRSPLRSTLTIGLMATASFLIVAIAAFRLQPTDEGTGGFDLVADSAQPLFEDLADEKVQLGLLGTDAAQVSGSTFVTCRVRAGQDASCNNLYRASEPTVLGIPSRSSADLEGFHFYAAGTTTDNENAWDLLAPSAAGTEDDPIPMILDQNTAMWSLQMYLGVGERKSFTYDNQTLHFEVVGLLENSLLQGRLMIGESNFQTHFPDISGYRFLLVRTKDEQSEAVAGALETRLGDIGLDASDAREVLSGMMAVQNTYLRTFQSLGGLGLLLGTIGLAIAQLRNVLERRSELAVMRAVGFTPGRLAALVLGETASLLLIGIGCGVVCAVIAVLPYAISTGTTPPIAEPLYLVAGIVLFGLLAGLVAATRVIRMPLLDSLRAA
ncbi:MAG: FtsX-like permease family protein, partial [Planctomycetota bacterium]